MAKKKDEDEDDEWWGITTAEDWQRATDVFPLWCMARDQTRFNRRLVNPERVKRYNRRQLYLLGVAFCRRVEDLFPHSSCHKALTVAEAFAEGTAKVGKLEAATEAVDLVDEGEPDLPVAKWAAARAVYWLGPDDYRVTEALEMVVDVAGYRAALAARILRPDAGYEAGERVWNRKPFKDGKKKEEKALCGIVRDVLGNPFRPVNFSKWRTSTAIALAKQMYKSNDFSAMPILADALQDAGCGNDEVLSHCRDTKQPHVRGCWVVDGVLGKG
jgi:hypothetical protein